MSEQMRKFLTEWLAWAEADAPVHPVFNPSAGLCFNLYAWAGFNAELGRELDRLFDGVMYPFGEADYYYHEANDTQHRDEKRLAWVQEQLA